MADPIKINLYIKSLGLSGKEAELKRKELEKLSNDELNNLISGKKSAEETPTWGLDNLRGAGSYSGEKFFSYNNDFGIMGWKGSTEPKEPKKYSAGEQLELRQFAGDFIYNSTLNAQDAIQNYNKDIGTISIHNGVNNFKSLIGAETSHEMEARLSDETKQAQNLKDIAPQKGKFEFKFEKDRKIEFNPENIEKLKEKSEEYTRLTAYQEKYNRLTEGLKHVKNVYAKNIAFEQARERGQVVPAQKETFEEEFIKVLDEFCNGDEDVRNEYIKKISEGITNKKDLNQNFLTCLEKLQKDCKSSLDKELGGKSFEEHTKEYNEVCRQAIGSEDAEKLARNYIENSKKYAAYGEIGVTIAISLMLPGSGFVGAASKKLALTFGEKAAAQIVKAGMTTTMASVPAALSAVDAATSENGFTPEKKAEILERWKSGLFYGGLGAYISGPIGNAVENLLATKPNVLTGVVKQAFNGKGLGTAAKTGGIAAETTADVLLDMITQNGDIISSLQSNGGMNIGMMIAGGRMAKMFKQKSPDIKIEQHTDGSYSLKDNNGKLIFKAADENILATFILGKASEASGTELMAAGNADRSMPNPAKTASQKLQDKVGLKVDAEKLGQEFPNAPLKYNVPSKDFIDVLRHFDPDVMEARYEKLGDQIDNVIKKHSDELTNLSNNFSNNKQAFSEKLVQILSKEFGLEGLEPPITQSNTGKDDGYWDWTKGELIINEKISDPKDAAKMISHEFRHVLQYKDILIKYGEDGLKQLCAKDKNPQKLFDETLKLPYTQKLLQFAKENPHAKDGIDDYMSRIYEDEMNDYKGSGHPEYLDQIMEGEAYFLGNNRTNRAYQENIHKNNDAALSGFIANLNSKLKNGEKLNTGTEEGLNKPANENFSVDEFGQIQRDLPAGRFRHDASNPIQPANKFALENGISVHMMKKYVELGKFELTENGMIDTTNPKNIKFLEEMNRPSLKTKEEVSEMLGIPVERLSAYVRSGKLIQDVTNKYDIENDINKAFLAQKPSPKDNSVITRGALSKELGINQHTIEYHIEKGRLRLNENNNIDLNDEVNRAFIESFNKGERKPKPPKAEIPVTEENVQSILGKLPLEYCIDNKLLVADENGKIDFDAEPNKTFIEKCKNKEISVNDYFVTKAEFARRSGNTETTLARAISNGKLKITEDGRLDVNDPLNAEYLKVYNAEHKNNPNLVNLTELAEVLGYKTTLSVKYHLENNRLVREPNGLIDVTKEPNKSFIESIKNGTYQKQRQSVDTKKAPKPQETAAENAEYRTQNEIAQEKGITQATLAFHLAKGHLVSSGRGKIDINDPKNAYFMANFQKGEKFIPYEAALPGAKVNEPKAPALDEVNPNIVSLKEFAQLAGITPTPLLYHMKKGRIVRGEDKKIDINNPQNRKFLESCISKADAKYENMSPDELNTAKRELQNKMLPFIGRETYINSEQILKSAPEQLDKYIDYTVKKIVNTEGFDPTELASLNDVFKEIITERINDKTRPSDFSDINLIALTSKCEIPTCKKLLELLSEPEVPAKEIKAAETRSGYEIKIEADEAFDEILSDIQAEFGEKIRTMRAIHDTENYPISKLVESYLFNRYLVLQQKNPDAVKDFIKENASSSGKRNPLASTDKLNVESFVEKILYRERTIPKNNEQFEKFKKIFDSKKIGASIESIVSQYKDNFYDTVCTQEALSALQEANKHANITVTQENVAAVINENFGIKNNDFKASQEVETARYKDRKGRRLPWENEMKEYIEAFHSVKTIETYNDFVQLYNKYCGVNRNDAVAKDILQTLKDLTDVNGKFNKENLLINEDIVKDIIKDFDKIVQTPKDVEINSLKSSYEEYGIITDELKNLIEASGLPKAEDITPENINKAKLFLGIMDKYGADVDIENIQTVLKNLDEKFNVDVSDIADIFEAEPIQNRGEFIAALTSPSGIKRINNKISLFKEWKEQVPKDLDISPYEYYVLRENMGLSGSQIFSSKTNLCEALNVDSFDAVKRYIKSLPNGRAKLIFEMFGQHHVDGLKSYIQEHNISSFKIKNSLINKPRKLLDLNAQSIGNNSYYNVTLNFKNKNANISESFQNICDVFKNLNGEITLKETDPASQIEISGENIINDLKKRVAVNTLKNTVYNNPAEYQNIFRELGIDTDKMKPHEIFEKLDNLTPSQTRKLEKLAAVLKCDAFDKMMTSLHCRMRFLERFMLTDDVDISNESACRDYIEDFGYTLKNKLNENVTIEVYQAGSDDAIIAPRFRVADNGRIYTITLDDSGKIHTIF